MTLRTDAPSPSAGIAAVYISLYQCAHPSDAAAEVGSSKDFASSSDLFRGFEPRREDFRGNLLLPFSPGLSYAGLIRGLEARLGEQSRLHVRAAPRTDRRPPWCCPSCWTLSHGPSFLNRGGKQKSPQKEEEKKSNPGHQEAYQHPPRVRVRELFRVGMAAMADSSSNSIRTNTVNNCIIDGQDPSPDLPPSIVSGGELEKAVIERGKWIRCFFYLDHLNTLPEKEEVSGGPHSVALPDGNTSNINNNTLIDRNHPSMRLLYLNVEAGRLRFRVSGGPQRTATLEEAILCRMELLGVRLSSFILMDIPNSNGEGNACVLPCERVEDIAAVVKTLRVVSRAAAEAIVEDPFIYSMNKPPLVKEDQNSEAVRVCRTSSAEKVENPPPPAMQTQRLLVDRSSQNPLRDSFYGGFVPEGGGDANYAWSAIHTCISAPITAFSYEGSAGIVSNAMITRSSSASETQISWNEEMTSSSENSLVSSSSSSSTFLLEEPNLENAFMAMPKRVAESTPYSTAFSSEESNNGGEESDGAIGPHHETSNTTESPFSPLLYHSLGASHQDASEPPSRVIARNPLQELEILHNAEATNRTLSMSPPKSLKLSSSFPLETHEDKEKLRRCCLENKNEKEETPTQALRSIAGRKRARSSLAEAHCADAPHKVEDSSSSSQAFIAHTLNKDNNDGHKRDNRINDIVEDSYSQTRSPTKVMLPSCPTAPANTHSPISFTPGDLPTSSSLGSLAFFSPTERVSFSRSPAGFCYSVEVPRSHTLGTSPTVDFTPNTGLSHDSLERNRAPAIVVTQQPMPDYIYRSDDSIADENPAEEEEEENPECRMDWW